MEDYKISFAAARVNKGLTQDDLAKSMGVSKSTIVSWESGKSYPDAKTLFTLCEMLGVPVQNIKIE